MIRELLNMVEIFILSILVILLLQGGCSLEASIDGGERKSVEMIWHEEDYSKHLQKLQERREEEEAEALKDPLKLND